MKKIVLVLCCFILCGCQNKLTCTYKENYNDIKINNRIVFDFSSNTYNQKDTMTFLDKEEASIYFEDIKDYIDQYNLVLEENKIISNLAGEIKLDATKEEIKKQYENYNYKCK